MMYALRWLDAKNKWHTDGGWLHAEPLFISYLTRAHVLVYSGAKIVDIHCNGKPYIRLFAEGTNEVPAVRKQKELG